MMRLILVCRDSAGAARDAQHSKRTPERSNPHYTSGMRGALISWTIFTASLAAQGTKPQAKPEDYPVHADLNGVTIAAENFGHGITSEYGALFAREYIAIDVAVFSKDKKALAFSAGQFTLRINGKKTPLLAQAPGMVAASIKYDDWTQRPGITGGGGLGNGGVTMGGPRPAERFPGDPNGRRPPSVPPVGTDDPNVPKEQPASLDEVLQRSSLPEGNQNVAPFSGFLYYPHTGKMSKIKSLELLYEGPYGEATIRLL